VVVVRQRTPFRDREHAGQLLAAALREAQHGGWSERRESIRPDSVVFGLPRGGVPVAAVVADAFDVELGVLVVRKLGVPGHEELAMGAVASGDVVVRNEGVIGGLGIAERIFDRVCAHERAELRAREERLGTVAGPPRIEGRQAIVVDDGVATGATMRAAVVAMRSLRPSAIIVAIPVAPSDTVETLGQLADVVVCVHQPADFTGVGGAYDDFTQTTDDEVRRLLRASHQRMLGRER
jgi:predicted phosphoribosyltransferase